MISHRFCDQFDCDHKFNTKYELKSPQWYAHNIPSMIAHRFYSCDQSDCDHKFKTKGHLKRHIKFVHDIGDHICSFCYDMKYMLPKGDW